MGGTSVVTKVTAGVSEGDVGQIGLFSWKTF